ncbi:MAG: ABC transporter permease [Dehalococcoidia bacterium]|nr:ABC transporter permease [Dehalococcoidia bacterium]
MLAIREMRRRKLQFALVTGVVALVSFLIIMVTGLGLGLYQRAGTALLSLNGDQLAYADNANLSLIRSRLTEAQVRDIEAKSGADDATPLGYIAAVIEYAPGRRDTAAVVGLVPGSFAEPRTIEGRALSSPDQILVDRSWARLAGTRVGDVLPLPVGFDRRNFTVAGIVDQGYFFFQPAVYVSLEAWQAIAYQGDASQRPAASVVLLKGKTLDASRGSGWEAVTKRTAFDNIEGVQAQQSTVNALRYMGLLIGAMVIGVFFYVITLQKVSLLGILKAIGASGFYLVTQGLLQVAVVSAVGALLAVGLAVLLQTTVLASSSVPIAFTTSAVLTTALSVLVAGMIGAGLSVRQVAAIDPIIAMQQQ